MFLFFQNPRSQHTGITLSEIQDNTRAAFFDIDKSPLIERLQHPVHSPSHGVEILLFGFRDDLKCYPPVRNARHTQISGAADEPGDLLLVSGKFPREHRLDLSERISCIGSKFHCAERSLFTEVKHIVDIAVVDRLDLIVRPEKFGGADIDLYNSALESSDLDHIPHTVCPLEDYADPGQDICHYIFRAQRDRKG